jgi:hypothetical protein
MSKSTLAKLFGSEPKCRQVELQPRHVNTWVRATLYNSGDINISAEMVGGSTGEDKLFRYGTDEHRELIKLFY